MRKNIFAWTSHAATLPDFISANVDDRGEVIITTRRQGQTLDFHIPAEHVKPLADALAKAAQ